MKHIKKWGLVALALPILILAQSIFAQTLDPRLYAPMIAGPGPNTTTPTATSTVVVTATPTSPPYIFPTATPFPPAPLGNVNLVCKTEDGRELCTWVSTATPDQNGFLRVYARLMVNGSPQRGYIFDSQWFYPNTTHGCRSYAARSDGLTSCTRTVPTATGGVRVNVDVTVGNMTVRTWFVPK